MQERHGHRSRAGDASVLVLSGVCDGAVLALASPGKE
jgi:hypothetical protein